MTATSVRRTCIVTTVVATILSSIYFLALTGDPIGGRIFNAVFGAIVILVLAVPITRWLLTRVSSDSD